MLQRTQGRSFSSVHSFSLLFNHISLLFSYVSLLFSHVSLLFNHVPFLVQSCFTFSIQEKRWWNWWNWELTYFFQADDQLFSCSVHLLFMTHAHAFWRTPLIINLKKKISFKNEIFRIKLWMSCTRKWMGSSILLTPFFFLIPAETVQEVGLVCSTEVFNLHTRNLVHYWSSSFLYFWAFFKEGVVSFWK